MIDIHLQKGIDQKISQLPREIAQALSSTNWLTTAMMIAREAGMDVNQVSIFQEETAGVVLGATHPEEYAAVLAQRLEISIESANLLVDEANERIFVEIEKNLLPEASEILPEHEEIAGTLSEEGIELLDHDVDMTVSTNIHQQVESLQSQFKNEELKNRHLFEESRKTSTKIKKPQTSAPRKKTVDNQEIKEEDLMGVGGHRVDTSILSQASPLQKKALNNYQVHTSKNSSSRDFENDRLESTQVSRDDHQDFSPVSRKNI